WGVVRALRGLFVTTDGRAGGPGHAKDARDAVGRLMQARELQESLSGLAQRHEAQQRDADQSDVVKAIKARNDAIRGKPSGGEQDFPELAEADLVLSSAAGISLAAERSAHIASNEDVAVTSGRHVGLAVGRSLFASVANALSLFVHKAGMKLVAAAGKVRIEAQTNGIDMTARQAVTNHEYGGQHSFARGEGDRAACRQDGGTHQRAGVRRAHGGRTYGLCGQSPDRRRAVATDALPGHARQAGAVCRALCADGACERLRAAESTVSGLAGRRARDRGRE
ncbi:type VI secretion system tip protein VgrG, partial [Burkholderia ubonensis]|uniref:type VI secretion system tip protein VgrG n=1 Tax=Burkholderia ubonensis TaxID=101571 RepID=UPI00211C6806